MDWKVWVGWVILNIVLSGAVAWVVVVFTLPTALQAFLERFAEIELEEDEEDCDFTDSCDSPNGTVRYWIN